MGASWLFAAIAVAPVVFFAFTAKSASASAEQYDQQQEEEQQAGIIFAKHAAVAEQHDEQQEKEQQAGVEPTFRVGTTTQAVEDVHKYAPLEMESSLQYARMSEWVKKKPRIFLSRGRNADNKINEGILVDFGRKKRLPSVIFNEGSILPKA